jgi:hypothetical protein
VPEARPLPARELRHRLPLRHIRRGQRSDTLLQVRVVAPCSSSGVIFFFVQVPDLT